MSFRTVRLRLATCASLLAVAVGSPSLATQVVYLNFERTSAVTDFTYSQDARDTIQFAIERDFALFDFQFTQTAPVSGDFSTLFFNDGPSFGVAEGIDFRNQNRNDRARIQTSSEFDPDGVDPTDFETEADFLRFTANIASHELGHILGLRHHDSIGPIGSGFSDDPGFLFGARNEFPSYTGPIQADQGIFHLMETSADFTNLISQPNHRMFDKYFGPREAVKLSFNEVADTHTLDETALELFQDDNGSDPGDGPFPGRTFRQIDLLDLNVPNPVEQGVLSRQKFNVEAIAITGRIAAALERDYYAFEGEAGDLINIEAMAQTLGPETLGGNDRYTEVIDPQITVFDSAGETISYFDADAFNDDDFEGAFDSFILDLVLPADDTYFIEVRSFASFDVGNYELFLHNFEAEQLEIGDFNRDGFVDAADYTIWRDTNGSTFDLRADADENGKVDDLDLEKWQENFGRETTVVVTPAQQAALAASSIATPEPATATSLLLAIAGLAARRR